MLAGMFLTCLSVVRSDLFDVFFHQAGNELFVCMRNLFELLYDQPLSCRLNDFDSALLSLYFADIDFKAFYPFVHACQQFRIDIL